MMLFLFMLVAPLSEDSLSIQQILEKGKRHERNQQIDSAIIEIQRCILLAKQQELYNILCEAYIFYGSLLGKTGHFNESISAFRTAQKVANKNSLEVLFGRALFGLGAVYLAKDENDSATFSLLKALTILEKNKDWKNVSAIKNNLSLLARRKGNLAKGLDLLRESITDNQKRRDTAKLIGNLRNLGLFYMETGAFDSALIHLKESYNLAGLLNSKEDQIVAQSGITKIHLKMGNEDFAFNSLLTSDSLINLLVHEDQAEVIAKLETKFRTAEIERDNAVKQARIELQERRMIFLYSIAGFLILGICAVYVYNEQRKKIIRTLALQKEQENRKQIQELLSQQELKSAYAMLAGQEKAHKRIAEELHDNLGSILVTLNMFADSLQKKTEPEALKELAKKISGAAELANETTRKISHSLHSGVLKHFGLATAVKELIDALNESHTTTVESHIQIDKKLDSEISLNIYRILQELINNTLKHAKASKIHIDLTQINERISLIYEDNGIGFEAGPDKGLGLRNLESRVERLNGELTIDSKPGIGTTTIIEIAIP